MDSDLENISDEEMGATIKLRRTGRQRTIRERPNHFNNWNDKEFRTRFRLSKPSAYAVLQLIAPHIQHPTNRNSVLDPENMLLLTLRLYASGGMLITAADFSGVSKSTACRVVTIVSHHVALLRTQFIKFPENDEDKKVIQKGFFNIARFPRVVGALDCTHVKILSPGGEQSELFRCRKNFFSINVQTICDSNLMILDMVARWPGSTHDSTIFNNSRICARLETGEFGDVLIVGDSGYPCRNYLMTPVNNVRNREENLYNESLIRTRNCIERSYGVWKRRFPILSLGIRLSLRKVQSIIVATAILHNICCLHRDTAPPDLDPEVEVVINSVLDASASYSTPSTGSENIVRRNLINSYFKNLL